MLPARSAVKNLKELAAAAHSVTRDNQDPYTDDVLRLVWQAAVSGDMAVDSRQLGWDPTKVRPALSRSEDYLFAAAASQQVGVLFDTWIELLTPPFDSRQRALRRFGGHSALFFVASTAVEQLSAVVQAYPADGRARIEAAYVQLEPDFFARASIDRALKAAGIGG